MKNPKELPFDKARRINKRKLVAARKAIELKTGVPQFPRGRPAKSEQGKYQSTSIRVNPRVMAWARKEAGERGRGYQMIINEILLEKAGADRSNKRVFCQFLLGSGFIRSSGGRYISDRQP
jgi:uncharacterized protein (DUF4415 family)